MSWVPQETSKPEHSDWSVETDDDLEYLGTTTGEGHPVLYDPDEMEAYRGRAEAEDRRIVPDEEPSWELDPDETIGEFLERVGKEAGWDWLSEFARDHLEDEDR